MQIKKRSKVIICLIFHTNVNKILGKNKKNSIKNKLLQILQQII